MPCGNDLRKSTEILFQIVITSYKNVNVNISCNWRKHKSSFRATGRNQWTQCWRETFTKPFVWKTDLASQFKTHPLSNTKWLYALSIPTPTWPWDSVASTTPSKSPRRFVMMPVQLWETAKLTPIWSWDSSATPRAKSRWKTTHRGPQWKKGGKRVSQSQAAMRQPLFWYVWPWVIPWSFCWHQDKLKMTEYHPSTIPTKRELFLCVILSFTFSYQVHSVHCPCLNEPLLVHWSASSSVCL